MNFTFEKSGDVGILTFDGELDRMRADEFKAALMLSLNNTGHVILNFEKVTGMDDSCFKLLRSAYRVSMKLNKRMTLTSCSPDIFRHADTDMDDSSVFNICPGNPYPVSDTAVRQQIH